MRKTSGGKVAARGRASPHRFASAQNCKKMTFLVRKMSALRQLALIRADNFRIFVIFKKS